MAITYLHLFLVWINDKDNKIAAEAIGVGLEQPPSGVNVASKEEMTSDTKEVVVAIEGK